MIALIEFVRLVHSASRHDFTLFISFASHTKIIDRLQFKSIPQMFSFLP